MPITLENRLRRMQVVNLPHDVVCGQKCACLKAKVAVTAESPRTGDRSAQHVVRHAAASITWLSLERKDDLPDVLLEVPEVKAALACGHLRLVKQSPMLSGGSSTAGATAASAPAAPGTTTEAVTPKEPR